jgi:hypothetical protein
MRPLAVNRDEIFWPGISLCGGTSAGVLGRFEAEAGLLVQGGM